MTDKEIMDKEIIKGLERMSEEDPCGFSSDVLDLIKEQQEEIEELQRTIRHYAIDKDLYLLPFETEYEAKFKREVIVEFVEKIEFKLRNTPSWNAVKENYKNIGFSYDTVMFHIDNLVKEMVGEEKKNDR